MDYHYLQLLSQSYPTTASVASAIINLRAILQLPKPTEHFMADLHGENEAFEHVLRNASGNIKRRVYDLFENKLSADELQGLCTLIYYPEQKLELIKNEHENLDVFYETTLHRLVAICRDVAAKYTRAKVRRWLPEEFAYVIEELLHTGVEVEDKREYYAVIVRSIIETHRSEAFITALCYLIQRLSVERLHILGDIFDRGPGAHIIMDRLCSYHHLDIAWGNHDMLWMGAAAGNLACIAAVLRLSLRYANTRTLEDGYGISLMALATFAMETYGDDPCTIFMPKTDEVAVNMSEKEQMLLARMHKAITVIGFKLEGQLYERHPEWKMEERAVLRGLNLQKGTVRIEGTDYELLDKNFPTINCDDPLRLSPEEENLMYRLRHSIDMSDRLRRHIKCLLLRGSMYGIYNNNLLYHASVPLCEDGSLREVEVRGQKVSGRALMDAVEQMVRAAFDDQLTKSDRKEGSDYIWYLWCGPDSPLFDKRKMATFERYFVADKSTHHEEKGWYYKLRDNEAVCDRILDDFGIDRKGHRHIINGHVPVHVSRGENPIKAGGKLMVIDGGFAKAYHDTTGIAGYTLVYHSRGFQLVQHEPFASAQDAIERGTDIRSTTQIVEMMGRRARVADTDKGMELRRQISDLKELLAAYRKGKIKEGR